MITTGKDLAPERQSKIAAMLRDHKVLRVNELCDELGVSPASVRRDLAQLERRGVLHRFHGGAMSAASRMEEPLFDDKTSIAAAEKQRIAQEASRFVQPEDSIFLDGGSTILALAALLTEHAGLTVVTNSLRVAQMFSGHGPRTILTGGELRRVSQTFVGPLTRPLLEQVRVDKAFMGTIGVSANDGLTTTDPREAQTKELVMAGAQQVYLLADSTKFATVSFVRFGRIQRLTALITDRNAPPRTVRALRKNGVRVIQA